MIEQRSMQLVNALRPHTGFCQLMASFCHIDYQDLYFLTFLYGAIMPRDNRAGIARGLMLFACSTG